MPSHNPYAPPASNVADIEETHSDESIEALPVSEKWKARFKAIARAGGTTLPNLKNLPKNERRNAYSFNVLAFLFGPLYYIAKGMWKKGLAILLAGVSVVVVLSIALGYFGLGKIAGSLGYGVSAVFAMRANIDYYKKMVLDENGWW